MGNKFKKGRYVTKASLRHITANDEASSLSGDFIIAHHSPALFRKGEDGRKKKREVLHLFRCYTHTYTCSETSYRITDVECIARAKTLQLDLTGDRE